MFAHLLMSGVESGSKTRVRLEPVRFMLVGHMGELHTDVTRGHWKTSTWHSLMLDMGREEWKYSYAQTRCLCYQERLLLRDCEGRRRAETISLSHKLNHEC